MKTSAANEFVCLMETSSALSRADIRAGYQSVQSSTLRPGKPAPDADRLNVSAALWVKKQTGAVQWAMSALCK